MAAMSCTTRTDGGGDGNDGDDCNGVLCLSVSPSDCYSGYLCPRPSPHSSAHAALSPPPSQFFHQSTSPTCVNLIGLPSISPASSICLSLDRPSAFPDLSFAVGSPHHHVGRDRKRPVGLPQAAATRRKRKCICSPTTHPGSFQCNLHKGGLGGKPSAGAPSSRLNARRSAMANSLVRIGAVEGGEWVRKALAAVIRPSSHQQRRRAAFQPRPSRLSIMSKADGL